MIGEAELVQAIDAAAFFRRGVLSETYAALGLELEPVEAYSRRYLAVCRAVDRPYNDAVRAAFLLAFELGYRVGAAARPAGSSRET